MTYRKLLCGLDLSDHSRAALKAAVELATSSGASLTLIHVPAPPPVIPDVTAEQLYAQMLGDVAALLADWKREAEELGAKEVDTLSVPGVAWSQIVQAARRGGHDVIVVGTHGHGGVFGVLIGSVAERVVRHAPCTVVVVRQAAPAAA